MIVSKGKLFLKPNFITLLIRNSTTSKGCGADVKFENTLNLPKQPVPKLDRTLEKYLKSVKPLVSCNDFQETRKIVRCFQKMEGPELQKCLEARAECKENWLTEWWEDVAYLGYRNPVVVHSSPGQQMSFETFKDEEARLQYTAKLILAALDFKLFIDSGKMKVEKMGNDNLDMNQYKKIFGTCRIPGMPKDKMQFNMYSEHIVVARNNHFFKLNVLNCKGEMPTVCQLVRSLRDIVDCSESPGPAVGILTTEHRDTWADAYEYLMKNSTNANSICAIQHSLFLVCLDDAMPSCEGTPYTLASHQLIHGGGSCGNAANRWFDKTVQFVIGKEGVVGLTYEHSPSEGQPIATMVDYLYDYIKKCPPNEAPDSNDDLDAEKLNFCVDSKLEDYIRYANMNIDRLVRNFDMNAFQFNHFGKNFIKTQSLSPDSFIQMAMQLAFYRLYNMPGAHYESAHNRKFIHGRTEAIRSCSVESVKFAKAMLESDCDNDKIEAMKKAINGHRAYTTDAVNGCGIDRHLLGLKLIAIERGTDVPDLYKDIAYTRSTHFRISTSQVATKCDGLMSYGAVVNDGYGCCYNPRDDCINIAVSAFHDNSETSASDFKCALDQSLKDMHDLLAKNQKAKL